MNDSENSRKEQMMIQTAAKVISYYEQNQVSLRNAMKILPKLIDYEEEDTYSRIHALVFETVRHQNVLNRIIHLNIQQHLKEKLPQNFRNLLRIITYLLTLTEEKNHQWEKACFTILNSVNNEELKSLLQDYSRTLQTWHIDTLLVNINDPEEKLAIQYSHPTWLIRDFVTFYGKNTTINILKSNNQILPVYLRLNLLNYRKKDIIAQLNEENVEIEEDPDLIDVVKVITWETPLPRLASFSEGIYYMQNKGSSLVSHILDPKVGEQILDVCAAPGGKTTHIASLQQDTGTIIALDNHVRRMNELVKKIELFKLKSIFPIIYDLRLGDTFQIKFDKILVDAPCSGSGTFASRPDSKWRVDRHQVKWLSKLQLLLLSKASSMLKRSPDASLVYSTCSLHPLENEEVIKQFLETYHKFELKPQKIFIGTPSTVFPLAQRLFPHVNQTEGFSIFKLGWKTP
ncbi:MAG: RsmB/NOP family class I SAM-dependent RNA methyltransferase [Candidatus Hermodarchaeota archaeon]